MSSSNQKASVRLCNDGARVRNLPAVINVSTSLAEFVTPHSAHR